MLLPDTPIQTTQEDQLGRAKFAKKLAENLSEWNQKDSIVIGLFGPWGSGKTSLVNMTLEHLETLKTRSDQQSLIIVKFNPWFISNTDELLSTFFTQVFSVIGSKSKKFKSFIKKRAKKYSKALQKSSKLPSVGGYMGSIGTLLDLAIREEGLFSHKIKLNNAFSKLNHKVVIVIDDLDRLRQVEIRQMLQIVKLNADFPNTIYLLAADRSVIEKSLDMEQGISGRDYLEKIVQVGFDIPPIDQTHITTLLQKGINQIIVEHPNIIDINRWTGIYQSGFRDFFTNLRDVKRFVNGLAFNLQLVSSEINIEDFIGLEAIRIFAPEVYKAISLNKELFTTIRNPTISKELKAQFEYIFGLDQKRGGNSKRIAIKLFPQLQSVYSNFMVNPAYLQNWRKAKRICAPENFELYFSLKIPVGEVSQAELDQIKNLAQDQEKLYKILQHLFEEGRFKRFLERFSDELDEIESQTAIQNLCEIIFELGDQSPDEPTFFVNLPTHQLIAQTAYRLLSKINESNERCQWLRDQIIGNSPLYSPLRQVAIAANYIQKGEETIFDEECIQKLKKVSVARIENEAESRQFTTRHFADFILLHWKEWASEQEKLQNFIDSSLETPEKAASLLAAFLTYQTFNFEVVRQVNFDNLQKLVDPKQVYSKVSQLSPEQLNKMPENTQFAIDSLTKYLQEKE